MKLSFVLVAALLVVYVGTAAAEIYRYADNKGELHFVDDISKVPKKYRNQLKNPRALKDVSVIDGTPAPRGLKRGYLPLSQSRSYGSANVELFVTSWCGYCRKMERFLKEKGIQYTAYDIEKDDNAARIHKELGGGGVPVVRIGSDVVHGYNLEAVMSYLNRK
jgi:glutaredoxin